MDGGPGRATVRGVCRDMTERLSTVRHLRQTELGGGGVQPVSLFSLFAQSLSTHPSLLDSFVYFEQRIISTLPFQSIPFYRGEFPYVFTQILTCYWSHFKLSVCLREWAQESGLSLDGPEIP